MMKWILPVIGCLACAGGGCSPTTTERRKLPELKAVDHVALSRYLGKWYEIATFPQSFQEGCVATTAEYELNDDGDIKVTNTCRKGGFDGEIDQVVGEARVIDKRSNAKLEVTFFWPFFGDYWIIDLGESYEFAVVSHPSRDYLWILSRTPTLPETTYQTILSRLQAKGFELNRLKKTPQPVE